MSVSPKSLVNRMTPTTRRTLEAAIGHAVTAQHYEITAEHMLRQMLEPDDGDVAAICRRSGRDRGALKARVDRILQCQRAGTRSRPLFSAYLWKWFQDAWVYGSLEYDASMLRSGHLFFALVVHPGRYLGETVPELEDFPREGLAGTLADTLSATKEQLESMRSSGNGASASDAIERRLAIFALRRGATVDGPLAAFRERRERLGVEASAWIELLLVALEREPDLSDPHAVARASRAADAAAAALRAPSPGPQ